MQLFRRSALRAASSPSTTFISQSRNINTSSSSFLLRAKIQSAGVTPSVFRRYSDDAAQGGQSFGIQRDGAGDRGGDRSPRGGYGGDRGGYGGDRGGDRNGYGGGRSFNNQRPPPPVVPSNTIYVGNLLFDITAADLEREFAQFGTIKAATLASDARQLSKGFGYIEFETVAEAEAAIEGKHQAVLEGRRMMVNFQNQSRNQNTEKNPPSKTLFVGNLAFEMSDADLNKLFRDVRNVIDVRVAIDRRTGQPRGFAHADFVDVESAVKGLEALQGQEVYGRKLRLDFSLDKSRSTRSEGESSEGAY